MRIAKHCLFRTDTINVLPAVLVTPLYDNVAPGSCLYHPFTLSDANTWTTREPDQRPNTDWYKAGFRLAFKFACIHAGIEVYYA